MTTMFIANDCTRQSGSFMGDQLCALKTAYLFVQHQPDVSRVLMSMSRHNEMDFLWEKFVGDPKGDGSIPPVEVIWEDWNPGDWDVRFLHWNRWRELRVAGVEKLDQPFLHYRELYLRIHGAMRQTALCGYERGIGKRNIYQYWYCGQEHSPDELPPSVDWFDDTLINHPKRCPRRDVYVSPHCKTQGNYVFTFDFWADVVGRLLDADVTVTVGYDGYFCPGLDAHPNFKRHWGDHRQWMEQVCQHKLVACGNTGTGWLAAACGTPMVTVEPHNSVMADHRYRECGLRNIVEVVDGHKLDELGNDMSGVAEYTARRIVDAVKRRLVLTTGCYDVLHAGHVRHLERARALGTRLVVALNSDASVVSIKGPDRPINPQEQRKTVLEALRCVDEVRIFGGPNAIPIIEELRPEVLACGYGYSLKDVVGKDLVESWGGEVAITCAGDARDEPSTTKIVKKLRSAEVVEACRAGALYSVNPLEKLMLMANEFLRVAHLPGDVADLGTYRGGSALVMRRLAPERHLHLFDTWAGTPYDDPMCHHKKGGWVADLTGCCQVVGSSDKTHFHRGDFPYLSTDPDGWYNFDQVEFCFVYVDMDTYQATRDAIEFFWPRIVQGGIMFFDDYGWEPCAGVKKAVDEAFPSSVVEHDVYNKRVVEPRYTCILERR